MKPPYFVFLSQFFKTAAVLFSFSISSSRAVFLCVMAVKYSMTATFTAPGILLSFGASAGVSAVELSGFFGFGPGNCMPSEIRISLMFAIGQAFNCARISICFFLFLGFFVRLYDFAVCHVHFVASLV